MKRNNLDGSLDTSFDKEGGLVIDSLKHDFIMCFDFELSQMEKS